MNVDCKVIPDEGLSSPGLKALGEALARWLKEIPVEMKAAGFDVEPRATNYDRQALEDLMAGELPKPQAPGMSNAVGPQAGRLVACPSERCFMATFRIVGRVPHWAVEVTLLSSFRRFVPAGVADVRAWAVPFKCEWELT